MDILKLLTHMGLIITALKDGEHAIADLVKKNNAAAEADGLKALGDLAQLFADGVVAIPGVDPQTVLDILNGLLPPGTPPIVLSVKQAKVEQQAKVDHQA